MYVFRTVLPTIVFLLVSTAADFAITSVHRCRLPDHFSVGTAKKDKIDIYEPQLIVGLPDNGFLVLRYPGSNTITFGNSNIVVNFNGKVIYNEQGASGMPPNQVSQVFVNRIAGIAQRTETNDIESSMINDCHIFLMPIGMDRLSVPIKVANTIRRVVEPCIQSEICQKIGNLSTNTKLGLPNVSGLAQLPGLIGPMPYTRPLNGPMPFQNALNTLVDSGLANLVAGLKATGQDKIYLPIIDSHFMAIQNVVNTDGHFEATNGIFSNVANLIRISPPKVSHDGTEFTISSKFAINAPTMSYKYKLRHGSITTMGTLTVKTNYINLKARFIADYSVMPCMTTLKQLQITDFGQISSLFTKAGGLKSLIAKRKWIDKEALADIGQTIEEHLRHDVESRLWTFNCEKYRT